MISSDQTSSSDKKHLDDRVFFLGSDRQNIPVLAARVSDLLFLRNLFHTADQFPVFNRALEFQRFGSGIHLLLQLSQNCIIISVQEPEYFIYRLSILLPGNIPLAGSIALLDMVVQAGPLFPDISGKAAVAAPQVIQFMDQVYRVPDSLRTCIRSEIPGLILKHLS